MSSTVASPPDAHPARAVGRVHAIDAARGLAIVLMLVDHLLALAVEYWLHGAAETAAMVARVTVTRAAMPLFMVLSGLLLGLSGRKVSRRRLIEAATVGLLVSSLMGHVEMNIGPPDILISWTAIMLLGNTLMQYPLTFAAVCAVQASVFNFQWDSYQPGIIGLLVVTGYLAANRNAAGAVTKLRSFGRAPVWLASIGRRPLIWYGGHMAVLGAVAIAFGGAS